MAQMRFAIVGSGPAGFFSAKSLFRHLPDCSVDMFEKLPSPFGLVRYGVAPDHAEVKNVINDFTALAASPAFRFIGNVEGKHIRHADLCRNYSAVIYAYGASEDRTLDIPGGSKTHSARKFVEWYNAHPYAESFDLSKVETVGIIGNGNVAIDIARIMGMNWESLEKTDINRETVEALKASNVKEIYMIGRRGAIQAAMTVKELRLLTMVPEISIRVFQDEIERSLNDVSQEEADLQSPVATNLQTRARRRLFDLMNSLPRVHKSSAKTKLDLRFLLEPVSYENNTLKLEKTALSGTKYNQIANRTGEFLSLSADLVFRSIGYKCIKIDSDLPFDESRGIVQNIAGRVPGSSPVYVTGWAKTGPFGVIDTTMRSVFHTMDSVFMDLDSGLIKPVSTTLPLPTGTVTFSEWLKVDRFEQAQGLQHGKPRDKVRSVGEMIRIAKE